MGEPNETPKQIDTIDAIFECAEKLGEDSSEKDKCTVWGRLVALVTKGCLSFPVTNQYSETVKRPEVDQEIYTKILTISKNTGWDPLSLLKRTGIITDRIFNFRDPDTLFTKNQLYLLHSMNLFEEYSVVLSELQSITPEIYLDSLKQILDRLTKRRKETNEKKTLIRYINKIILEFSEKYGMYR